jgi:hypothetical protein
MASVDHIESGQYQALNSVQGIALFLLQCLSRPLTDTFARSFIED